MGEKRRAAELAVSQHLASPPVAELNRDIALRADLSPGSEKPQDYEIGPQDVLTITFFNIDPNADGFPGNLQARVSEEGVITLPLVGTVQVRGKVTEVCEKMGCWMNLVDPATNVRVRIKVKDGEIVFPKEAIGKMAVAEGRSVKIELTREQAIERAKHEAEENHKPFDPSSITGPVTIYQIQGTGAVIE